MIFSRVKPQAIWLVVGNVFKAKMKKLDYNIAQMTFKRRV